ncbi:hypothetical protein ONS96_003446 [Cadophora gregata f. sp. sojae]|nr:hypothetical protein ONS96_003446 [Cadophora gregata f. sp. sojae]
MRSVERDDLQEPDNMIDTPAGDDVNQGRMNYSPSRSPDNPELSMLNHDSKTPHTSLGLDNKNMMKRPADSQWLKGSYVSKRARWEGPAVPSPTPLPDVLERDRRRRQLSARKLDQSKVKVYKSSHLSKSFPNNESGEVPIHRLAQIRNLEIPQEPHCQSDYGAISTFVCEKRTSHIGYEDFGHQPDDLDELQDNSQEDFFRPAPRSSVKSKKVQAPIDNRSLSDLEPDDLIAIKPRTKQSTGVSVDHSPTSDSCILNRDLDDSYDLPELPRSYRKRTAGDDYEDEDSFVTEVAPSSRNVEKFQFRKRRSRSQMPVRREENCGISEDGRNIISDAQSRQSVGRYKPPGVIQRADETPEYLSHEQVSSIRAPPRDENPLRESQATPPKSEKPKSEKANSSWDQATDVNQSSSFTREANVPQNTSPPKSTSSRSASPITTPKHRAETSLLSSLTGHLLRSFRKSDKPPAAEKEPRIPVCSNEMSTQSFNTTPPGSLVRSDRKCLLREPISQQSKAKAKLQRSIPTEMDMIQLALSQTCPSPSSEDRLHERTEGPSQEICIEDALASKAKGLEPRQTGGNVSSPDIRSQTQRGLALALPDMEFTSFTDESFLFLGGYLTETANEVAAAAPEDNQEKKSRPGIIQHRSPASVNEVVGIRLQEHSRMVSENVQTSRAASRETVGEPVDETRPLALGTSEDVGIEKDLEDIDVQDKSNIQISCQSVGVTNSARAASEAEYRDQLSDDYSSHSIPGLAIFEGDESTFNTAQKHLDSKLANRDARSTFAASPRHQSQRSLENGIQDDWIEMPGTATREQGSKIATDSDQNSKKTTAASVIRHDEAAAVRPGDQRDEPANGSETSWEGCGPQSPWADEKMELLPTVFSRRQSEDASPRHTKCNESYHTEPARLGNRPLTEEVSWVAIRRPSTPDCGGIKPFRDFSTPTASPGSRTADLRRTSIDTLSLDAAMRNPWTSSSKNRSPAKSRKRVSFGIMPLDEESLQGRARPEKNTPRSPPPAQADPTDQEEDIFHDGTTVTTTFNKHFVAASRPRQFRRILPEVRASQLNSSPAKLEAQAEAFIAADHDIPTDQGPTSVNVTASRHLTARSDSNTNSSWNDKGEGEDDGSMLGSPFSRSPLERVPGRQTSLKTFDMALALGEAAGFLEDWSVDTVLKPVKERDSTNRDDSNGMRRRKLFGLL